MMLSLGWGLVGGMLVTLILVPIAYACEHDVSRFIKTINLKRFIPGLGLLLFFTLPIYAEELPDTLFIQKALKNNPDYQFILEQQIGELHQIDLSVAVSDIVTSVLLGASYNFDNEETIPDSSLKISKLFYPTGTNVNAFYQNRRFAGSNFKVESYGAAFSQDLLQNAFGRNNRLTLQNTSLQKKIIQIQTLESIEDYIAKLHQIYNDWTESFKRVQLERNILNNIELLRKEVQLKYKRRIASKNDVDRVRLQELNQRGILIDTEKQLKHDADHIGQLMNDFNTYTPIVKPIIRFSLAIPSENRSLQALSLMEEANEIETKIRANELFPSITLDTSIFNEARTVNNVRTDNLFLTGGLGIDLPVSNQSKQLSYQLSKSIQRQSQLTLAASKLAYQNDSNRLADEILVLERRFQIDEKKARLANDILRQDGDDYRRGSISLNEYIESLNRSIQSQHAILSRSIQYQRARIEWYRLTDRLITPTP
ncbi:MAG: TolC family protein [Candidatus Margulisiibacteriota bacterium]